MQVLIKFNLSKENNFQYNLDRNTDIIGKRFVTQTLVVKVKNEEDKIGLNGIESCDFVLLIKNDDKKFKLDKESNFIVSKNSVIVLENPPESEVIEVKIIGCIQDNNSLNNIQQQKFNDYHTEDYEEEESELDEDFDEEESQLSNSKSNNSKSNSKSHNDSNDSIDETENLEEESNLEELLDEIDDINEDILLTEELKDDKINHTDNTLKLNHQSANITSNNENNKKYFLRRKRPNSTNLNFDQ